MHQEANQQVIEILKENEMLKQILKEREAKLQYLKKQIDKKGVQQQEDKYLARSKIEAEYKSKISKMQKEIDRLTIVNNKNVNSKTVQNNLKVMNENKVLVKHILNEESKTAEMEKIIDDLSNKLESTQNTNKSQADTKISNNKILGIIDRIKNEFDDSLDINYRFDTKNNSKKESLLNNINSLESLLEISMADHRSLKLENQRLVSEMNDKKLRIEDLEEQLDEKESEHGITNNKLAEMVTNLERDKEACYEAYIQKINDLQESINKSNLLLKRSEETVQQLSTEKFVFQYQLNRVQKVFTNSKFWKMLKQWSDVFIQISKSTNEGFGDHLCDLNTKKQTIENELARIEDDLKKEVLQKDNSNKMSKKVKLEDQ